MTNTAIIVLDVGKTMSKLSLWSAQGDLIERESRANQRAVEAGIARLDVAGITPWMIRTLRKFSKLADVGHIVPVAHGAGLAAVNEDQLAFTPIDYEVTVPPQVAASYQGERDGFALTGSPLLAEGMNAAIQLYLAESISRSVLRGSTIMPWAQYWGWVLTGIARSEVTSLGCHSDLWVPDAGTYSPMARRLGWADRMAPLAFAGDVLGSLRPDIAAQTGLTTQVKVYCGLHDSNAALIAARGFEQIRGNEATVLSTGTWFVAMRTPMESTELTGLSAVQDCLINVDAWGTPIPSSRFMGGREIETLVGLDTRRVDIKPDQPDLLAAVPKLLKEKVFLSPTFAHGFGPFPDRRGRWINMPDNWFARRAAACLYAALVADTSLNLVGAKNTILIEGRFAEAEVFVRALAALRNRDKVYVSHAQNDVSFGALRLIQPDLKPSGALQRVQPLDIDLTDYKSEWLSLTRDAPELGAPI